MRTPSHTCPSSLVSQTLLTLTLALASAASGTQRSQSITRYTRHSPSSTYVLSHQAQR